MQLIRDRRVRASETDELRKIVHVDESPNYDLLSSLRTLYSPRGYPAFRRWAISTRRKMPADLFEEGRALFQGHDTCVGFGVVRLVPDLPRGAGPEKLIDQVRKADAATIAVHMIEGTGELPSERVAALRRLLDGRPSSAKIAGAVRGFSAARRQRVEWILEDPKRAQKQLARFLERYVAAIFTGILPDLKQPLAGAARSARDTLGVLPAVEAIERLTGGYTVAQDLPLRRITLAPSAFLYPYVAARIDEEHGDALIMYGVPSEIAGTDDPAPVDPALARAMKALSDENRLRILQLVAQKPRYGPEIVELLGLSQPTVHHHIAQLRAAELLRQERTRNGMLFTLRQEGVDHVLGALGSVLRETTGPRTLRPVKAVKG